MKRILMIIATLALSVIGSAHAALTYDFSFEDKTNYWPGWGYYPSDNNVDEIGIPTIDYVEGSVSNGFLNEVYFSFRSDTWYGGYQSPDLGDLFIDVGADGTWDYVLDFSSTGGWLTEANGYQTEATLYYFYDGGIELNSDSYILSDYYWSGTGDRDYHPVGIDLTGLNYDTLFTYNNSDSYASLGNYYFFTTYEDGSSTNGGTFLTDTSENTSANNDTGTLSLLLGDLINVGGSDFIIGFGPSCANDVIYSQVTSPTPEPATILLMTTGLAGLALFRRKKTIS